MTVILAKVSASLAERGRPEMWANEQEAAALSGMCPERFRQQLPALEARRFPKPSAWNGKRFVPAILEFWSGEHSQVPVEGAGANGQDEKIKLENFGERTRKRRPG